MGKKNDFLLDVVHLFRIQGFETPEEMFLLGYLTSKGGEQYLIDAFKNDLNLIEHNTKFWLPHVKDTLQTHIGVTYEQTEKAEELLKKLLETRGKEPPEWLKQRIKKDKWKLLTEKLIEHYKSIARNELHRNRGGFLTYLLEAFIRADRQNTLLMLPLMEQLTRKYNLKPEKEEEKGEQEKTASNLS